MKKKTQLFFLFLILILVASLLPVSSSTTKSDPSSTSAIKSINPVTPVYAETSAKPPSGKTMKLGSLLAMTGSGAFYGKVMNQAILLAIEEINGAGGAGGVKLELIVEDHLSGDAKAGASAGQKLINMDRVPWIFTSFSAPTLSVQPMAAAANVLMVNGGAVSALMLNKPFLYSTRLLSNIGAKALTDYAWKQGYKKMAMIYWNDPAGLMSADAGRARWKELGGTVVAEEPYEKGATDYTANIAKIKAAKPDVFALIGAWTKDIGFIAKQAREMGITVPLLGVDWSPDSQAVAGQAFEGFRYILDYFDPNGADSWTQKFVKAYKAKWNMEPEIYAANYYELTYILKSIVEGAVKEGKDPFSGANLRDQLLKIRTFPSVYGGTLKINDDGSCVKPIAVFEVKAAKPVVIETLK